MCGVCTCGSHKCPGCIPHPKFDGTTTYSLQFQTPHGERVVKRSDELRRKRFEDAGLTKSEPGHYATTTTLSLTKPLADQQKLPVEAYRSKSFKPVERRMYTSGFAGKTTAETNFASPKNPQVATKIVPPTTAHKAMLEMNQVGKPVGFFSSTAREMHPTHRVPSTDLRLPVVIHHPTLNVEAVKFDADSTYHQEYIERKRTDPIPTRTMKYPPHVRTPVISPTPQLPPDTFRTTSQLAYAPIPVEARYGGRCLAALLPRRAPSADGHIRFRQDAISPSLNATLH